MTLDQVAGELCRRLSNLFLPGPYGQRPSHGKDLRYADDPHWKDLILFYEYFHGDTGRGVGASHQTGWTALVTRMLGVPPRGTRHRYTHDGTRLSPARSENIVPAIQ